jgi:hypothetical protein
MKNNTSVIQDWVTNYCTWKMQTVLLVALRGCDGLSKNDLSKPFIRLMRSTILKNADSSTTFFPDVTSPHESVSRVAIIELLNDMDHYPVHWFMHFVHAAEIVGYKHPDANVRSYWQHFYLLALNELHVNAETEEQLDHRLQDNRGL